MNTEAVSVTGIREPLRLLENSLREGEPLPEEFVARMSRLVESGGIEILAAKDGERTVGVLVLAIRPNISLGGDFASIEDIHVEPDSRRKGIGESLAEKAAEVCRERGISYVEVHTEEEGAREFYARLGYGEEADVRVFSRSYPLHED